MMGLEPTEKDAASLVQRRLGLEPRSVTRFTTGLANYVYEVGTSANDTVVVRLNKVGREENFVGAVYWYYRLEPRGVPLPRLLCYDVSPADGSFPFMISTRVAGQDLDAVYPMLTGAEKRSLAMRLTAIQASVGQMSLGSGFGYARSYADPSLHPTWMAFLQAELAWSQDKIQSVGIVDPTCADRVGAKLEAYRPYLVTVEPQCFLDDVALKNVLVHDGHLSGIVDVDWVCFGDPLLPVALTQVRLLMQGWDTDFVSFWVDALGLESERKHVLTLYAALWAVNSLSLIGRRFGNNVAISGDRREVSSLIGLLDQLVLSL